jgi:hypothetical protein
MKMISGSEDAEDDEENSKIFVDVFLFYYQIPNIGEENSNEDMRSPHDSSRNTKTVSHLIKINKNFYLFFIHLHSFL